jgi:heme-degrading monooxygenase HmoA
MFSGVWVFRGASVPKVTPNRAEDTETPENRPPSPGEGVTGTVWTDDEAVQAGVAAGEQRRAEAASRGVVLEDATVREVIVQAM